MEFYESQAIYLQMADMLCEQIVQKKWKANEKIPSVRQISVEMEVNPNTAMRTYTYLQDHDIIYNKRGIGYFLSDTGYAKAQALLKEKFISYDLPRFIKTMDLLKISFDDIKTLKNKTL